MSNDSDETETRRGRPSPYNEKIAEKILELAAKGKKDEEIADIIGVHVRTLGNWKGRHPDFFQALKESKQVANDLVEASMFHRAIGCKTKATKVFLSEGEIIVHEYEVEHPPDTRAAELWLNNRDPDRWRNKTEIEHSGAIKEISDEELDKIIAEKMKKLAGGEE